ncbi:MAG TPA: hypothetical protein PKA02_02805 [Candidatus Saccharibacteria bacterium]|mgnify:CR=1 FL=1|nr:hypothetical protein [Candidatus Saccharibacteria bacterium]
MLRRVQKHRLEGEPNTEGATVIVRERLSRREFALRLGMVVVAFSVAGQFTGNRVSDYFAKRNGQEIQPILDDTSADLKKNLSDKADHMDRSISDAEKSLDKARREIKEFRHDLGLDRPPQPTTTTTTLSPNGLAAAVSTTTTTTTAPVGPPAPLTTTP